MKIRIPWIGQIELKFKSDSILELERLVAALEKENPTPPKIRNTYGATGNTGITGTSGNVGLIGTTGIAGAICSTGVTGFSGIQCGNAFGSFAGGYAAGQAFRHQQNQLNQLGSYQQVEPNPFI
jgi:hypothetical protein